MRSKVRERERVSRREWRKRVVAVKETEMEKVRFQNDFKIFCFRNSQDTHHNNSNSPTNSSKETDRHLGGRTDERQTDEREKNTNKSLQKIENFPPLFRAL